MVAEEVARLDGYLEKIAVMRRKDATPMIKLHSMDRRLRIQSRRAKLLGLDKPQKFEHSGSIATDPQTEALAILDELQPATTRPDHRSHEDQQAET